MTFGRPTIASTACGAVVVALVLAVAALGRGTVRSPELAPNPPTRIPGGGGNGRGPAWKAAFDATHGGNGLPGWVAPTIIAFFLVAFVTFLWMGRRGLGFRPRTHAGRDEAVLEPDRLAAPVSAALSDALADALHDPDPRDAVIRCWVRLEDAAARAGVRRRQSETSTELGERILAALDVSSEALGLLSRLYLEARYSTHQPDEQVRDEALAVFERVRGEIRGAAVPGR